MKKIFTLFAAMLVAFAVNAEDQTPSPSTRNSLATAVSAVGDGETVYLATGNYYNVKGTAEISGDNYTFLDGKSFTIQALEDNSPVIKFEVPFNVKNGANVKFIGIKFDGTNLTGYDRYIDIVDANDNILEFENCEFTNISKYIFQIRSSKKLSSIVFKNCNFHDNTNRAILNQGILDFCEVSNSTFDKFTGNYPIFDNYDSGLWGYLIIKGSEFSNNNYAVVHASGDAHENHMNKLYIDNCYFHDSKRTAVFFEAPTSTAAKCDEVVVTNSTFANFHAESYWSSIIDVENGGSQTDLGSVLVDHCTFYNNETFYNAHACIRVYKSTNALVSNCLFVMPESYDRYATYLYGGEIKNCLTYNYSYSGGASTYGHKPGTTRTDLIWEDPLFVAPSAATPDYTLQVAGTRSPALNAGEYNSHMGDPRWWPTFYITGDHDSWTLKATEMSIFDYGHYYKVITGTPGSIEKFKINNGAWGPEGGAVWDKANIDNSWGDVTLSDADGDGVGTDVAVTIPSDGRVTIYFDLKENKIWAKGIPTVELTGEVTSGTPEAMTNQTGDVECSKTISLTPGTYEFQVKINSALFGNNGTMNRTNSTGWTMDDTNNSCAITIDVPGDYVFTYTYGSKKMTVSYPNSFTRSGSANFGSLCVPFDAQLENGKAYSFTSVAGNTVTFDEVEGNLEAGHSYLIKAIDSNEDITIKQVPYSNAVAAAINPATDVAGLWGRLGDTDNYSYNAEWPGYILQNGQFYMISSGVSVTIRSTYAYLHVPAGAAAPDHFRIIEGEENATNIEEINGNEQVVKFIRDGKVYILRDGITYDVMGRMIK